MLVPKNSIAQTIQRLETENFLNRESIANIEQTIAANEASIAEMAPLAEWEEVANG